MRTLFALLIFANPALAWESTSSGPVCLLAQDAGAASVTVSHDPREAVPYAIRIVRKHIVWIKAPTFFIRFDGPSGLTISTRHYQLSGDGMALTVTDRGFGSVLAGMASNFVAVAVLGQQSILIPLEDAAPAVEAFQECIRSAKI